MFYLLCVVGWKHTRSLTVAQLIDTNTWSSDNPVICLRSKTFVILCRNPSFPTSYSNGVVGRAAFRIQESRYRSWVSHHWPAMCVTLCKWLGASVSQFTSYTVKTEILLFCSPFFGGVSSLQWQQQWKGSLERAELSWASNSPVPRPVETSPSQDELHCGVVGLGWVDTNYFNHKHSGIRAPLP